MMAGVSSGSASAPAPAPPARNRRKGTAGRKQPSEARSGSGVHALLFAAVLGVYANTLHPTLVGGDSPEFANITCSGGVPHPPGYPLLALLSQIFAWLLPFGSVAWRLNLLNAIISATAATFLFATVEKLTHGMQEAALLAAGLFASSPLIWQYAIHMEVFALNNCLTAMLFHQLVAWEQAGGDVRGGGGAHLGALLAGLGLCNQHTFLFNAAAVVLYVLARLACYRRLSVLSFCTLSLSFFAGLLPYAYLPLASARRAAFSWGDLTSMDGFWVHFLRKEYGTFRLFSGSDRTGAGVTILTGLRMYASHLMEDTWCTAPVWLFIVFIATATRHPLVLHPGPVAVILLSLVSYIAVFHYLANIPLDAHPIFVSVQKRFWMQGDICVYILAGVAVGGFLYFWRHILPRAGFKFLPKGEAGGRGQYTFVGVAAAVVVVRVACGWNTMQQSDNWYLWHYGMSHLEPLPQNAMLVVWGDLQQYSIRYLQLCEGVRSDVSIVDLAMASYPWYVPSQRRNVPNMHYPQDIYHPQAPNTFSLGDLFDANIDRIPVFTLNPPPNDISWKRRYRLLPVGVVLQVVPRDTIVDPAVWLRESRLALPEFSLPSPVLYGPSSWEARLVVEMQSGLHAFIKEAIQQASAPNTHSLDLLVAAIEVLRRLDQELPAGDPTKSDVAFDLGYAHQELWKRTQDPAHHQHMLLGFQLFDKVAAHDDGRRAQVSRVLDYYQEHLPRS